MRQANLTLPSDTYIPSLETLLPPAPEQRAGKPLPPLLGALLAGLWWMVCSGLSVHWRLNPQYSYGWFVPALVLYAGIQRWRTRPRAESPLPGALPVVLVLSAAILPVWIFSLPNADWEAFGWVFTSLAAGVTLGLAALMGGRAWLVHFAGPVLLMFTAAAWPDTIAAPLMKALMSFVASAAVTLLDLAGFSAMQHGNLIEVSTGVVGVSEACSGVRSLQGALMVSLVLGEIYRFTLPRRGVLLVLSLAVALGTNILRATFLAGTAARLGNAVVEKWHDSAGMTTLAACTTIIFGLAMWIGRKAPPVLALRQPPEPHPLPRFLLPGLVAWLVLVAGAAELWYYDPSPVPQAAWRLAPPSGSTPVEIPAAAQGLLHFDHANTGEWTDEGGLQWLLYYFEWDYGPAFARVAAGMHHPDICLPAAGTEMTERRGRLSFTAEEGKELPFQAYVFQQNGRPLYVYHGIWPIRSARGLLHGPMAPSKQQAAWQSILWRERSVGQQSAEVMVTNVSGADGADAALRELLPKLYSSRTPPATPPSLSMTAAPSSVQP